MQAKKPDKPYKDFPLTPHPRGTWCKKIKGKLYHFGGWSNPDAALAKYRHQVDDLQAGREPSPPPSETDLTLERLCFEFLDAKQVRVNTGNMTRRMLLDYQRSCKRLCEILGRNKVVQTMKPADFDRLTAALSNGVSIVTQANRIRAAKVLFRFAYTQDLIEHPLKFGENFRVPDRARLRAERQKAGSIEFTAKELRTLIDAAGVPLKAMILLGINCGLGNADISSMSMARIDLNKGWHTMPRQKTAVERRCPLWPETLEAIKQAIAARPAPKSESDSDLVFLTKYGNPFVRLNAKGTNLDGVGGEFNKLLRNLKLNGKRRAFYSLRRTFQTVAENAADQVAVQYIMGHAPESGDMSAVYRQSIFSKRLSIVTDYVRKWLWPRTKKAA